MKPDSSLNDELDIRELALILWKKRLILIGTTLASIALGMVYASNQNVIYRGELAIHPLRSHELAGFELWNKTIAVGLKEIGEAVDEKSLNSSIVTSEDLIKKFESSYLRGDQLKAALRQHSAATQIFEGNEDELLSRLASLQSTFTLEHTTSGIVNIAFDTSDKNESRKVLSTMHSLISDDVKTDMLRSIRANVERINLGLKYKLDRISVETEAYAKLYELQKSRSLIIMREQAAIARHLEIETPIALLSNTSEMGSLSDIERTAVDAFRRSDFLLGYRAIEQYIDKIQQRTESQHTILSTATDTLVRERIQQQALNYAEFLTSLSDQLPLSDADFKVVRADIDNIKFTTKNKKLLVVMIFGIAGLMVATISIMLHHAFQIRKSDPNLA